MEIVDTLHVEVFGPSRGGSQVAEAPRSLVSLEKWWLVRWPASAEWEEGAAAVGVGVDERMGCL